MSPQDDPGRPDGDKPEGLSKYLKRMRTVLRPRSSAKRQSVATLPDVLASSNAPVAAAAATPLRKSTGAEPSMLNDYSTIQQEKARALFTKYGLTLEPGEWKSPTDLQLTRVTKPIRMRVRRTCHRCETTFGPDKVCVNCQHPRCKKCPRNPPIQEKDPKEYPSTSISKSKIPEIRAQHGGISYTPHLRYTGDPNAPLTMPSRSGKDLVKKNVGQRVRRICHGCETVFAPGSKECASCQHVRCKRCPRDPPKPDKYPDGYPGDVDPPKLRPDRTFKQPRRRVHYICHVCETDYNPGANTCAKCGQAKCAETIRIPPKKIKREPDPEILRRVEEKLAGLNIRQ